MSIEGAAAIAAVGFAVLSSLAALAVSFGANRHRLGRIERDLQRHLDDAPAVKVALAEVLVELRHIREAIAELKARP